MVYTPQHESLISQFSQQMGLKDTDKGALFDGVNDVLQHPDTYGLKGDESAEVVVKKAFNTLFAVSGHRD